MAFYEAYSHPALLRYHTRVCTGATLFLLVVLGLTYICPLLVAYRSQGRRRPAEMLTGVTCVASPVCVCVFLPGFWVKRATYEEQAVVRFQYQTLLVAGTSVEGDFVAWSTFPHLNNMMGANLRIPAVSVRTSTHNTHFVHTCASHVCETQARDAHVCTHMYVSHTCVYNTHASHACVSHMHLMHLSYMCIIYICHTHMCITCM